MKHFNLKRMLAVTLAAIILLMPGASALTYTTVIDAVYTDAEIFSNGYAAVAKGGKWAYIDQSGKNITSERYDFAAPFSEGKAIVGLVKNVENVTENGIEVPKLNMEMRYIDTKGVEYPFENADGTKFVAKSFTPSDEYVFYGGVVRMMNGDTPCYFKADGTPLGFTPNFVPTEGKMIFFNEENYKDGIKITDMAGQPLLEISGKENSYGYVTTRVYPFNQGMAMTDLVKFDDKGVVTEYAYGFIDITGKFVIAPKYRDFYRAGMQEYRIFNDSGLASLSNGQKYGAINVDGQDVIPFEYDQLFVFQEGLAPFLKGGLWGAVNIYGVEVIPAKYQSLTQFNNGYALAYQNGSAFFVDANGNEYKNVFDAQEGFDLSAYVSEEILPDGTKVISSYPPTELMVLKKNERYGYVKAGLPAITPTYDSPDEWAKDEVFNAIKANLVPSSLRNGYKSNITRGDFAVLLCQLLKALTGKEADALVMEKTGKDLNYHISQYPFKDAYEPEVIALSALGLIAGTPDGYFKPYDNINRQDAGVLIMRTASFAGIKTGDVRLEPCRDYGDISEYAAQGVEFVRTLNIMKGNAQGDFLPQSRYTRQEAYISLMRTFSCKK